MKKCVSCKQPISYWRQLYPPPEIRVKRAGEVIFDGYVCNYNCFRAYQQRHNYSQKYDFEFKK